MAQHPTGDTSARAKPKRLLYVVTEDWFFCSHFLPMARAAKAAGFEVAIATRIGTKGEVLAAEGLSVFPLEGRRGRIGPIALIAESIALLRVMRRFRPDLLHLIALKPVLLAGMVGRLLRIKAIVCAVTGQGYLAAADGVRADLMRRTVGLVLTWLFRSPHTHLLLENPDDAAPYADAIPDLRDRCTQVGGAGVDPADFPTTPLPHHQPPVAVLVARMLWSKGVDVAVAAQQQLWTQGQQLVLRLVGAPDPENPRAVPLATLEEWSRLPGIEWLGRRSDIAAIWQDADIAVIPSRGGEGLPRALLEAASSGRPIITSDVPGCRDFVRDGVEGFIVAPGSIEDLAQGLAKLTNNPDLRTRLGANAHARLLDGYTEAQVAAAVGSLYKRLVAARGSL
jgi:glycosyltransferase involved in cell wall biosynthesis